MKKPSAFFEKVCSNTHVEVVFVLVPSGEIAGKIIKTYHKNPRSNYGKIEILLVDYGKFEKQFFATQIAESMAFPESFDFCNLNFWRETSVKHMLERLQDNGYKIVK